MTVSCLLKWRNEKCGIDAGQALKLTQISYMWSPFEPHILKNVREKDANEFCDVSKVASKPKHERKKKRDDAHLPRRTVVALFSVVIVVTAPLESCRYTLVLFSLSRSHSFSHSFKLLV
jgi:hypothetical protein